MHKDTLLMGMEPLMDTLLSAIFPNGAGEAHSPALRKGVNAAQCRQLSSACSQQRVASATLTKNHSHPGCSKKGTKTFWETVRWHGMNWENVPMGHIWADTYMPVHWQCHRSVSFASRNAGRGHHLPSDSHRSGDCNVLLVFHNEEGLD